jgi:hypothetical protein
MERLQLQPRAAIGLAAIGMPDALNELCGQFDWVQRSLIFIYVELEQGPISLIYAHSRHGRQGIKSTH